MLEFKHEGLQFLLLPISFLQDIDRTEICIRLYGQKPGPLGGSALIPRLQHKYEGYENNAH